MRTPAERLLKAEVFVSVVHVCVITHPSGGSPVPLPFADAALSLRVSEEH